MATTFLEMVRSRHRMRNNPDTDPVPWELDDKHLAEQYVADLGYRVPRSIKAASITEAFELGRSEFGNRFVLKPSGLHSGIGVYMLNEISAGLYYEARRLTILTPSDIVAPGAPWASAISYWLAEEWVSTNTSGHEIPPDYRMYTFNGQVTHIAYSDYNFYPPHRSIFDGAWIPLRPGVDYWCNFNLKQTTPVFPRHAEALLSMAQDLSTRLNTRFVRIDLFDGPDGPVFGEFSFFPGSDDTGEVTYSRRVLDLLNRATQGDDVDALSGYDIDMSGWWSAVNGTNHATYDIPHAAFSQLSLAGLGGHSQFFESMRNALPTRDTRGVLELGLAVGAELAGDRQRAFDVSHSLRSRPPFVRSSRMVDQSDARAIAFADGMAERNVWWRARAAELRLANGDARAAEVLRDLARDGVSHAKRVLDAHGMAID